MSLPIDKQYLISSLKEFDEKILSKKYSNNIEIKPLKNSELMSIIKRASEDLDNN
ncbi:MAG: hypothetical protein NC489_22955 [Ruminococcus flavefaciens]|nr:hypothetical protein [Ruminococcus flavefaciens]